MGVTFTPVFNRKGAKSKSGLYSIHIRVTIDRITDYINPKLPKIEKKYWSGKQNKWIKESHLSSFEINSLLQRKISDLDKFIVKLLIWEKPITHDAIKEFYTLKGDGSIFNEFIEEYIRTVRGIAPNTLKAYKTFEKHLNAFNPRIRFSDLNEDLLSKFKVYLEDEKELGGAAVKKYFDKFKVVCKAAVKKNLLDLNHNPFTTTDIKIKVDQAKRTYLQIAEIKKLKIASLKDKQLIRIRDLFLFQIYSGMYLSDLRKLKKVNLIMTELGYYIVDDRSKNRNQMIVPIYKFPNATEIIDKYSQSNTDFVFPDIGTDQYYNRQLKELGDLAKLDKSLTNKVGRHTNAQLWIGLGVERQFVSKMLGHTNEATTQHYYDIDIVNLNDKLGNVNFEKLGI